MTGKRCMIYLNVQFKIFVQSIMTQKSNNSGRIVIVLMFGRFTRFWFDKKYTFESLFPRIITGKSKKFCQVILFAFHICVEQGHVSFSSSPEYIILTTQCNGSIQCILYLCSCIG